MKLNPNIERLNKHFRGDQFKHILFFLEMCVEKPWDNEDLLKLIKDNDLDGFQHDLYFIFESFESKWEMAFDHYKELSEGKKNEVKEAVNELSELKDFLNDANGVPEIKLSYPTGSFTIKSYDLATAIKAYIAEDITRLKEKHLYNYIYKLKNPFRSNIPEDIPFLLYAADLYKRKDSPFKAFSIYTYGFFQYLKSETHFKDKTDKDTRDFIIDFCEIAGTNWQNISETPEDYLKTLYQNIDKYLDI